MYYVSLENLLSIEDLVDRAAYFAVDAHKGQTRKNKVTPVCMHLFEASTVAISICEDLMRENIIDKTELKNIVAAVLLHDTVEDTTTTEENIYEYFGKRVGDLVMGETEQHPGGVADSSTWQVRKEESLKRLAESDDIGVKVMWLADKVSNIRSYYRMRMLKGKNMWDCFHEKDNEKQKWYYYRVAELLKDLSFTSAYGEYMRLTDIVFDDKYN